MVSFLPAPTTVDNQSIMQGVSGVAIKPAVENIATGTSASGAAGTLVAQIVAAANNVLLAIQILASHPNTANTQLKIIITYSDSTTDNLTTVAAATSAVIGNGAGLLYLDLSALGSGSFQGLAAKDITGVRVETAGTGVGTRTATIRAWQVRTT